MTTDDIGMEILLPPACLELLAAHEPKMGRVGVIRDDRPVVLPVNYAIVDGAVEFRTGRGSKLAAALDGALVAFEVDEIDPSWEEGWSVVVHGRAEVLDSDDEAVHSWVPAVCAHRIRIEPERITGRSMEAGKLRRVVVPT